MSYLCADDVLPKELVEAIQCYVSGVSIYIPCKEKKVWGSRTETKEYYHLRNQEICEKQAQGKSVKSLAEEYALTEKSIRRIVRYTHRQKNPEEEKMENYQFINLLQRPDLRNTAAGWFHSKWGVPVEAYLQCIDEYLEGKTPLGWYLCLCGEEIVGGMGVIENDFHDRKDLGPNVCAVYTEEKHRKKGIAGRLLAIVVEELREKGISPVYLNTNHIGFYERYGWEFFCTVLGDGETEPSRLYIHR